MRAALLLAARLVDQLDAQREAEHAAFQQGFEIGYGHGHDVGFSHAENDIEAAWQETARKISALGRGPTVEESKRRLYPPDGDEWRWVRHLDQLCPGLPVCDGEHKR